MDRGAWPTTVHGVTKSRTRLSNLSTHRGDGDCEYIELRSVSPGHMTGKRQAPN